MNFKNEKHALSVVIVLIISIKVFSFSRNDTMPGWIPSKTILQSENQHSPLGLFKHPIKTHRGSSFPAYRPQWLSLFLPLVWKIIFINSLLYVVSQIKLPASSVFGILLLMNKQTWHINTNIYTVLLCVTHRGYQNKNLSSSSVEKRRWTCRKIKYNPAQRL